jgi:UDP-N-acetylglucosamine 2-epimerase (non-hydrolysing)
MKKILFIFGTRPEAIKLAPLIKKFEKNKKDFTPIICSTGQHKEMLDQVVDFFKLHIDYDLQLMKKNQTLSSLSSNIISSLQEVISEVKPDYVFVHGDTTTSTMAAISSFYNQVPVCHIEAGLRTFNKYSPFPEEMNRSITGRIAEYHFSPTLESKQNLVKENIDENSILVTGNTVIDALLFAVNELKTYENNEIKNLKSLMVEGKKNILVTGHRRENFGIGFENICNALLEIANDKNVQIIYPVHLNPNVTSIVERMLGNHDNIHLINPLNYPAFVWLMNKSTVILTDSGGVQEEAPSLGVPVLVMRNNTERPEGVKEGTAILVGTNKEKIVNTTQKLLKDQNFYDSISRVNNPYGDGDSSKNILNFLIDRDNK